MTTDKLITTLAEQGAAKPLPHPLVLATKWLGWILVYFAIVVLVVGVRPDLAVKWQESWFLLESFLMLFTAGAALFAASFLGLPDTGQKPWLRYVPFIPLAIMVGCLMFLVFSGASMTLAECLRAGEYDCIIHLVLFSLAPALLLFTALQKAAPYFGGWAGGMVGLAAGSLGYVMLRLTEDTDDASVIALWHLLPVAMLTILCMLLGRQALRRWAHS